MFDTKVDTRGLDQALKLFAKEARKDLDEIVKGQCGIMVGHLIAFTPPAASKGQAMSDNGGITTEAKKRGEASLSADISKLFVTTRMKKEKALGLIESGHKWETQGRPRKILEYAENLQDLERIHKFSRSRSTGKVRIGTSGQNMAVTTRALRSEFIRKKKKMVGYLNAGWLNAARELKTSKRATPVWITRHTVRSGGVSYRNTKSGLTVTMANNIGYFPRNMDQRLQRAINRREYALTKALESMIERKAKMAEMRMRKKR